jgi:cytoskeleton protein RodZ
MNDNTAEPIAPEAVVEAALNAVTAPEPTQTAGQMIKEAREAAGLHIGSLSMALKVPVKKLEALESDDWTQLPDVVFARALATSVCRQIKTDSAPILAALPRTTPHRTLGDGEKKTLNQPFRLPTDAKFSWSLSTKATPLAIGALVLLLAATALIFLPDFTKLTDAPSSQVTLPAVTAPVMTAPAVTPPIESPTAMPPVSSAVVLSSPARVPPVIASAPSIAAAAPVQPSASSPTPTPTPTPTPVMVASPVFRVEAKGVVWVEVKDSKGTVLIQRSLQPKEIASVSGLPPLAVVIGRINEIASVTVRGKPFSLNGMSPDNVARFEVK